MTFHPAVAGCYCNNRPVEALAPKLEFRLNVVPTDDVPFRAFRQFLLIWANPSCQSHTFRNQLFLEYYWNI